MSAGTSPSTAAKSFACHSVVCGRHGPVRYGWSSSSGSVDKNLPTTSTSIRGSHHETDCRSRASADVQGAERLRPLDLIVARGATYLSRGIDQHPHTGCPDRMTAADQSAAGVDRQPPTNADVAVLDCLPRLARRCQPDVIYRKIFAWREAV